MRVQSLCKSNVELKMMSTTMQPKEFLHNVRILGNIGQTKQRYHPHSPLHRLLLKMRVCIEGV